MVKLTPYTKSQIIRMDLQGLSFGQIAKEAGVSKSTVFNVVHEWSEKVNASYIEEIRFFLTEVRRSGITLQECIKGFRIWQILRAFQIQDEYEGWFDSEEEPSVDPENFDFSSYESKLNQSNSNNSYDVNKRIDNKSRKVKETGQKKLLVADFITEIYEKCKTHSIKPTIIIKWMLDLLDFFSFTVKNDNKDDVEQDTLQHHEKASEATNAINKHDDEIDQDIPFVSQVNSFLEQKKNHIHHLEKVKNSLKDEVDDLSSRKNLLTDAVNRAIQNKNQIFSYFNWYESLRNDLYQKQKIVLRDNIDNLVRAISDFKNFEFDVTRVIEAYNEIESLVTQKEKLEIQIDYNQNLKNYWEAEVTKLEESAKYYTQTIDTYNQLHKYGLGLKELKQLTNLIYESALSNNLDVKGSIEKFFKDVEEQYDNKLGFDKVVKELKEEKKKLELEVPEYKFYLQLQGIVSPTLIHLHSRGVTNEDIIGMNHLVLEFQNSDFLSDPFQKTIQNINNNNPKDKLSYWYLFVSKLSSLKNINTKINKRISEMDQLSRQIIDLTHKKDQLDSLYLNAATNVNTLISKLYECADLVKSINERLIPKPIIFVVFTNFDVSNHKDSEKKEEK